jgi:hypothetical protein
VVVGGQGAVIGAISGFQGGAGIDVAGGAELPGDRLERHILHVERAAPTGKGIHFWGVES